jgi:anti-anti-sigma factor
MDDTYVDEIWDYQTGHARIFVVRGELDADLSADLRRRLETALLGPPEALLIDLEDVTFIDVAALGDLVTVFQEAREVGAATRLVAPSAAVQGLLRATQTEGDFPMNGNLTAAYGEVSAEAPETTSERDDAA